MPPGLVVLDGLWNCLCPSISSRAALRIIQAPTSVVLRLSPARRVAAPRPQCGHHRLQRGQLRQLHSAYPVRHRLAEGDDASGRLELGRRTGGARWRPKFGPAAGSVVAGVEDVGERGAVELENESVGEVSELNDEVSKHGTSADFPLKERLEARERSPWSERRTQWQEFNEEASNICKAEGQEKILREEELLIEESRKHAPLPLRGVAHGNRKDNWTPGLHNTQRRQHLVRGPTDETYQKDIFGDDMHPADLSNQAGGRGFYVFENGQMVNYEELPTHILYEKLRAYALGLKKSPTKAIIQYLIQNRGEGPNPQLYSALILYNTSAEDGSAPMTRALWDEMRAARIEPTSSNCEDVLKVLSVHPDYLFRHEVLDYMNERWFKLSVDALHDVVAGTLRERQLEFALDKLEELIEQRDAKPWIYDMAVYVLVEAGELNEALRILKLRVANCLNGPSSSLWHHFLDQASSLYNHEATEYVWKSQVESGYLIPPSGICENVMATAARHGDVQLATDVFRFLGDRKTVFNHSHYEMLIDAYVATGDIKTALHILCVMNDAGVVPSLPSTRSLTYYMSEEQRRSRWGFKVLYQLAQQKDKKIPRAGINAVIEASVRGAHFEDALEQYKALHAVCKFGPDRHTFNALLKGAVANDRKDIAMFLAAEMGALKVKPDSLTYDRLLLICIADKDCDGAMGYYGDMRARGWLPRRGTLNALVKTFALRKDLRAFKVLQDMVDAGHEVWKLKGWLRDHWEGPQYELDALFGSVDFEKDFDEDATRPMSIKAMSG